MRKIKLSKDYTVKVYDSIDELPIVNYQRYNKYLLLDSGIGSDMESIQGHINTILKFINKGDNANAVAELQNMQMNLLMIANNISPKHLAFMALVHSINDKPITDYSDDNLKSLLHKLNSVNNSKLIDLLDGIKKKITSELETYFPDTFITAKDKEVCTLLYRYISLKLDGIIAGELDTVELTKLEDALFKRYKPNNFIGTNSIEVEYDKQFETSCAIIAQEMHIDAKRMTVLRYYSTLDLINKQAEYKAKQLKKH